MSEISAESLASQTRQHLMDQLKLGRWRKGLPAERKLSEMLGVSRPILRSALKELEEGGYVILEKRKRIPSSKVKIKPKQQRALIVHSSEPASMPASTAQILQMLKERLEAQHTSVKSVVCVALKQSEVAASLSDLHNEYPNEIWVLRSPSIAALDWCEQHHPQCVVLGAQPQPALFDGVDLDIDKVFQHSMHLCCEQQKCRVVFIVPRGVSHAASKLESFLESYAESGMSAQMEKMPSGEAHQAKRQILHLLSAQPRPNAFVCTNFQQWLLVYSVLVEAKLSPLKDVFLLCHYDDPLMQCISHGVGHYAFDWPKAADFLAERVVKFRGSERAKILLLSPKYVER